MAALSLVSDYIATARVLLQDNVAPYRYADAELIVALNLGIQEARRLRPDLFLSSFRTTLPSYTSTAQAVAIDEQYRPAFLYYIVGHAQMRDDEDTTDARAASFMGRFVAQLGALSA